MILLTMKGKEIATRRCSRIFQRLSQSAAYTQHYSSVYFANFNGHGPFFPLKKDPSSARSSQSQKYILFFFFSPLTLILRTFDWPLCDWLGMKKVHLHPRSSVPA